MIYFDHNATSPLHKCALMAMESLYDLPLNASSIHGYGRNAKNLLETARTHIACAVNASNDFQVIFTSSGTEANNLAVSSMKTITTCIEHLSVLNVVGEGIINVDSNGIVDINHMEQLLRSQHEPILVSIIMANNEVGVIQPIKEIAAIAHKYNCFIHVDASQNIGKTPIDIEDLDVDMITLCAHKCGGPIGVGALIFKKNLDIKPVIKGGGQEMRYRAGTQNIPAIHGFGVLCKNINQVISEFQSCIIIRDFLEQQIINISPNTIIFSQNVSRLPNTSCFTMPDVLSETQVIHFDLNGFAISAGAACSSGKVNLPHVQMSMNYAKSIAQTAIRVSLSVTNTLNEISKFIAIWRELFLKTRLRNELCNS